MADILGNRTAKTKKGEEDPVLKAETTKRKSKKDLINAKLQLAVKSPTQPTNPVTRSNKEVVYYINNLDEDLERKRDAHGTAINVPVFVEEFRVLEALYEKERKKYGATSFVDFIRKYLDVKAQKDLGQAEYKKVMDEKLNQVVRNIEDANSGIDELAEKKVYR